MSWAAKRQLLVIFILLVLVGGLGFLYYAPKIFVVPSCSDMKQNGDEGGVDCGGTCARYCASQIADPTVLWSRSFPITNNIYNAVAYIENTNVGATRSLPYEFRLYDKDGLFLTRVQGTAVIPPTGRYAIVETGINVGIATVSRTTIDFDESHATWERIPDDIASIRLATSNLALSNTDTVPKLTATITNPSILDTLSHTTIAAIVYDKDDNAITASKTLVQSIGPGKSQTVFFTWPRPLAAPAVRFELLPIINVFEVGKQ